MRRSLLVCLAVLLAFAAIAVTAVAMESRFVGHTSPAGPAQDDMARVAVAHLAPFSTTTVVTVEVDGNPAIPNFAFGDSTGYIELTTGTHTVAIYPMGSETPALSQTIELEAQDYTAIAVGGTKGWDLDLLLLDDTVMTPTSPMLKVRVGHLAPFADTAAGTLADVRQQDGTPLLPMSVPYTTVSPYLDLTAGTYDLKITAPGGAPTLIDPMPAMFAGGDILSVFAVGDGDNQPLGIFVLPQGEEGTFLDLAAAVQVAHLAPFAGAGMTDVTVRIDGTDVLTDFTFAESTGYLPLEAGVDHDIEILPTGGSVVFSTTVNLEHPERYTAIAIGGTMGWPVDLKLLMDDTTPPGSGMAKVRIGHLAPFSDTIAGTMADVRLQDGTPLTTTITYDSVGDYVSLEAGTYVLKITAPGGDPTLIGPVMATLDEGDIVSLFAVGDGDNQPLGVFALPSGEPGALLPLARYIYLPFVVRSEPQ